MSFYNSRKTCNAQEGYRFFSRTEASKTTSSFTITERIHEIRVAIAQSSVIQNDYIPS